MLGIAQEEPVKKFMTAILFVSVFVTSTSLSCKSDEAVVDVVAETSDDITVTEDVTIVEETVADEDVLAAEEVAPAEDLVLTEDLVIDEDALPPTEDLVEPVAMFLGKQPDAFDWCGKTNSMFFGNRPMDLELGCGPTKRAGDIEMSPMKVASGVTFKDCYVTCCGVVICEQDKKRPGLCICV
jgi:hypothetical protein